MSSATKPANSKVAIVTGGAQGIGKGISHHLLTEGWSVILADSDRQAGEEARAELEGLGNALFLECDVSRESSVAGMVEQALERWGRLEALINNAGIADPLTGPVESLCLEDWNRVIGTNLTGAFLCVKHTVPFLRRSRGAVVNIASTRALMSEPNSEAYAASKGGMVALTHALSVSLGPEIRVNCISPGWIDVSEWKKKSERRPPNLSRADHSQHPAGRVGTPADIAELAEFLITDRSGFITGQNFVVDGGMTRKMIYVEE
jgi:NAD(P)-dependent dehydrogenase (short-subunit alcohol dehydrogenase family)